MCFPLWRASLRHALMVVAIIIYLIHSNFINKGLEQPFAATGTVGIQSTAQHPFDLAVSRLGHVKFQTDNVLNKELDTYCYNNYSIGIDPNGILYVFEVFLHHSSIAISAIITPSSFRFKQMVD